MNIKNTTLALTLSVFSAGIFAHHLEEFQTPLNDYFEKSVTSSPYTDNTIEKKFNIFPDDEEYLKSTTQFVHRSSHLMGVEPGYPLIDESRRDENRKMVLKVNDVYNISVYEMIVEQNGGPVACDVDERGRLQLFLHDGEVRHSFTVVGTEGPQIERLADGSCRIHDEVAIYINNLQFPSLSTTTTSSDEETESDEQGKKKNGSDH